MSRRKANTIEVVVGNSYGTRDTDLADAARRWWKIKPKRSEDLQFLVARRHWKDKPLAVYRIVGSAVTDSGRVEFSVTDASADEERTVLAAVGGREVDFGAFRYAST